MHLGIKKIKQIFSIDADKGLVYWNADIGTRGKKGQIAGTTKPNDGRYFRVMYNGKSYKTHHIIYALHHGVWPSPQIDHINGDSYDNRIVNLRAAPQAENNKNAKNRKDNKSGIRGVCWNEKKKRWISQIGVFGKIVQTCSSVDFFEACCSRKSAEKTYGFHANHGRI